MPVSLLRVSRTQTSPVTGLLAMVCMLFSAFTDTLAFYIRSCVVALTEARCRDRSYRQLVTCHFLV